MSQFDRALGRLAAERGIASQEQVAECLRAARKSPTPRNLAQIMLERGVATAEQVEDLVRDAGASVDQPAAPAVRLGPSQNFGRYEILSELGRGGMGAVYKARDTQLDRLVALKILSDRLVATDDDVHRFQRESKLAARLKHPHLVQIFEAGIIGGIPYFTMEFVEGETMDAVLIDALACEFRPDWEPRLTRDAICRLMIKVAEAVHVAHRAGIIHRDIKPANIIIDAQNEPHVMDFGLAKEVSSHTWLTSTGIAMGTPYYMPPEQARGEVRDLDVRADVYALGAVLYHAVTLKLPYQEATGAAVLRKVIDEDPVAPRVIDPTIDRKLERIIQKSMAKERKDRYPTAGDFARDLERFLSGQPIAARGPSLMSHAKRWVRRNPAWAGAAIVAVILLGVFGGYLFLRPGLLTVETDPAGADVFIDGSSLTSKTPLTDFRLSRGSHEIRISRDGFRDEVLRLDLAPGGRETRSLKLEPREGRLTLESVPPRVEVVLTGPKRIAIKTPIDSLSLPEGRYRVEAFHPGFQMCVFPIDVRDRQTVARRFSLLPAKVWVAGAGSAVYQRAAVTDADGDGKPDLVVATEDGRLRALSGVNGAVIWTFDTRFRGPTELVLADADGDGQPEIFVGAGASGFQCLRSDGAPRYTVRLSNRTFLASELPDVNGDSTPDVVAAGWDSELSVFSGKALLGLSATRLWKMPLTGRALDAPRVGDWDAAEGREILTVTEGGHVSVHALADGSLVREFDLPAAPVAWMVDGVRLVSLAKESVWAVGVDDGTVKWTAALPAPGTTLSPPGLVGGEPHVAVVAEDGTLMALSMAKGEERWRWRAEQTIRAAPVWADVDGDGELEVVAGSDSTRLHVIDGRSGAPRWHFPAGDKIRVPAVVMDLTGDGLPELLVGTQDGSFYAVSFSSR